MRFPFPLVSSIQAVVDAKADRVEGDTTLAQSFQHLQIPKLGREVREGVVVVSSLHTTGNEGLAAGSSSPRANDLWFARAAPSLRLKN